MQNLMDRDKIIVRVSSTKMRTVVSLSHIQAKYNEGFMANQQS